jgi:hypothetical protein
MLDLQKLKIIPLGGKDQINETDGHQDIGTQ